MGRTVIALALCGAVALAGGCATTADPVDGEESEMIERLRRDIRLDPLLTSSRVTVVERDGVIVFGGSVDSLQDLNIVRDVVDEVEDDLGDENAVRNDVVYLGDEGDDADPSSSGS